MTSLFLTLSPFFTMGFWFRQVLWFERWNFTRL